MKEKPHVDVADLNDVITGSDDVVAVEPLSVVGESQYNISEGLFYFFVRLNS